MEPAETILCMTRIYHGRRCSQIDAAFPNMDAGMGKSRRFGEQEITFHEIGNNFPVRLMDSESGTAPIF